MKQLLKWQCDYCGELFNSDESCLEHEERHERVYKANRMLKDGHTLMEIQNECNIWRSIPEHLKDVTTDNCFVVSHWQCCDKPAYRIIKIEMDGRVSLWGCGSWSGYYGNEVHLNSTCLLTPHSKEELFVDLRYKRF